MSSVYRDNEAGSMFGRNHKEIEDAVISRLGENQGFHYMISKKRGFPWIKLQREEDTDAPTLDMIIVVQEPNSAVFGDGGRLRNLILDYSARQNARIILVAGNDPQGVLKDFPQPTLTFVLDNLQGYIPFRECVWAQKGPKDYLVGIYDPTHDETVFFDNNPEIGKKVRKELKPLIQHITPQT